MPDVLNCTSVIKSIEDAVDDPYRGTNFYELTRKIRNVVGTTLLLGVGRCAERGFRRFRCRKQRLRRTKLNPGRGHTAAGNRNSVRFYDDATGFHCDAASWNGNTANHSADSGRRIRVSGEYHEPDKSNSRNDARSQLDDESNARQQHSAFNRKSEYCENARHNAQRLTLRISTRHGRNDPGIDQSRYGESRLIADHWQQ